MCHCCGRALRRHLAKPTASATSQAGSREDRSTVYGYFCAFLAAGLWESMRHHFVVMLREAEGREASPTAAVIDTQSVKTTAKGGLVAGMRPSG